MVHKDGGEILKDLNLVPSVTSSADEIQCALYSYRATRKTHVKTHYKLKHLGGADLCKNCSICWKKCTTKSNLKAHLVGAHKLTRMDDGIT